MPASTHVELVLTQQTLWLRECVCLHCIIRRDVVFFRDAFMSAETIRLINQTHYATCCSKRSIAGGGSKMYL